MEKYYTLSDASKILGVKLRTLRLWRKDGFLTAFRYEGKRKWLISQSEIERLQNGMTKK